MTTYNLTSDLINRYSDVSVSDEVCYGLCSDLDDHDNFVGKIFEANFEGGSSFWNVFEETGLISFGDDIDEDLAVKCLEVLNSDSIMNNNDDEAVLSLRVLMNDLTTLVGVKEAFNIVSNFDGDAW
jgi:hypothetical protein